MAEQDPVGMDEFMGDVLGQLEASFAQLQSALIESNEKTAIYERFDQSISQAIAEALEAAGNIRSRAVRDAEAAQELLRQEAVRSLQELTNVREQFQKICQEMRQAQEDQRLALQRKREERERELAEMRRKSEEEIFRLRAQALDERKALLEEIGSLQEQRDVIYQQVETSLLGQLRTLKRSLNTEPAAQETPSPPAQQTDQTGIITESLPTKPSDVSPAPPQWWRGAEVEEEGPERKRRRGIWRALFGRF